MKKSIFLKFNISKKINIIKYSFLLKNVKKRQNDKKKDEKMVFYANLWPKYVSNILNQSILDNIISLAHEALEILSKFVVPITG